MLSTRLQQLSSSDLTGLLLQSDLFTKSSEQASEKLRKMLNSNLPQPPRSSTISSHASLCLANAGCLAGGLLSFIPVRSDPVGATAMPNGMNAASLELLIINASNLPTLRRKSVQTSVQF